MINSQRNLHKINSVLPKNKFLDQENKEKFKGFFTSDEIKQIAQINDQEVLLLWQELVYTADLTCLRYFLDISPEYIRLKEPSIIKAIASFFKNKITAVLWCKLIEAQKNEGADLISAVELFKGFILSLNQSSITDKELVSLQELTSRQFRAFLLVLDKVDLSFQIKYLHPALDNVSHAILDSKFIFINHKMVSMINDLFQNSLPDLPEFLKSILGSLDNDNTDRIRALCLIYMSYYCPEDAVKLEPCLTLLDQELLNRRIPRNIYCLILQIIIASTKSVSTLRIFNFIKTSLWLYQNTANKIFRLITLENIDNCIPKLEKISELIEYLTKMHVSMPLHNFTSLDDASNQLEELRFEYTKSTMYHRDLEDILTDFKGNNPNVTFPLSDIELTQIKAQFLQIQHFEQQFKLLSNSELTELINEIKSNIHYDNPLSVDLKNENISKLIAIANRAFVQFLNIYPYNVQILAVLGIMLPSGSFKGRLAQIRTGEGKSTILTLLILILAAQGKSVDVITSTEYLAIRDEQKYKQFFSFFGITSSNVCTHEITQDEFSGQVVYGTNYNFEFAVLFDKLYLKGSRVMHDNKKVARPFHVVVVDEVDNMLVDKALNSARISYSKAQSLKMVYPIIYDYIAKSCMDKKPDITIFESCKSLITGCDIPDITLKQLINSAYKACFELKLNIDYCIRRNTSDNNRKKSSDVCEIIIIDKDTGRLCENSRWQHGLHQFLEYKHKLPVKAESLTLGSLSHPGFFSYYAEIFGVTGTIGSDIEREEIAQIYNLTTFDVPTYRPTLRKQLETIIFNSPEEFNSFMLTEIQQIVNAGRPTLVLCHSINNSRDLYNLVKEKIFNARIQLLNDIQEEQEEFIVVNAGGKATVTIATNAAGRGTDIPLSKEARQNGGLHVIFTFLPNNERVELQGAGRSGRQGSPGSYRILVPHNDPLVLQVKQDRLKQNLLQILTGEFLTDCPISLDELLKFRYQQITNESITRRHYAAINLVQYKLLEKFCAWYQVESLKPTFDKHTTLTKFAELYTSIDDIPETIDNLDSKNETEFNAALIEYQQKIDNLVKEHQLGFPG